MSAAGEGFLARQRRILVAAEFRRSEAISMSPQPGGDETIGQYLASGTWARRLSRWYNLLIAVVCLVSMLACSAVLVGGGVFPPWSAPFVAGCAFVMLYVGLRLFAGWRCMWRHRKRSTA